jgi:hypothetical protein
MKRLLKKRKRQCRFLESGNDIEANLAAVYALTGQIRQARERQLQLTADAEGFHTGQLLLGIAQIHALLGEKDEAFLWLEKAFQNRHGGLTLVKVIPYLDSLHGDPRLADLVRRIGLPE